MPNDNIWKALDASFLSGSSELMGIKGFSLGKVIADEIYSLRLVERATCYGINRGFSEISAPLFSLLEVMRTVNNNKSMIPGLAGAAEIKQKYTEAKEALLPYLTTEKYGFRSDVLLYIECAERNAKRIAEGCELSTEATLPIAEHSLKLLSEIRTLVLDAVDESSEAALTEAAAILAGIRRWNNVTMLDTLEMGEGSEFETTSPLKSARAAAERWSRLYTGVTKKNPIASEGISPRYSEKHDALAYAAGVIEV